MEEKFEALQNKLMISGQAAQIVTNEPISAALLRKVMSVPKTKPTAANAKIAVPGQNSKSNLFSMAYKMPVVPKSKGKMIIPKIVSETAIYKALSPCLMSATAIAAQRSTT